MGVGIIKELVDLAIILASCKANKQNRVNSTIKSRAPGPDTLQEGAMDYPIDHKLTFVSPTPLTHIVNPKSDIPTAGAQKESFLNFQWLNSSHEAPKSQPIVRFQALPGDVSSILDALDDFGEDFRTSKSLGARIEG